MADKKAMRDHVRRILALDPDSATLDRLVDEAAAFHGVRRRAIVRLLPKDRVARTTVEGRQLTSIEHDGVGGHVVRSGERVHLMVMDAPTAAQLQHQRVKVELPGETWTTARHRWNGAGYCARKACERRHDGRPHSTNGLLYCDTCRDDINTRCGEEVVLMEHPTSPMPLDAVRERAVAVREAMVAAGGGGE